MAAALLTTARYRETSTQIPRSVSLKSIPVVQRQNPTSQFSVRLLHKPQNQDDPRRHSKEECTAESRIKVHKRIKKVESAPHIRVHGESILRQLGSLQRRISMPIMPKRSLVLCAANVLPFDARPICMRNPPRDGRGSYGCTG